MYQLARAGVAEKRPEEWRVQQMEGGLVWFQSAANCEVPEVVCGEICEVHGIFGGMHWWAR